MEALAKRSARKAATILAPLAAVSLLSYFGMAFSKPTMADVIVPFDVDGKIRLYNPQSFSQSGSLVISPLGGGQDSTEAYALNAHQVLEFPVTAGRVAVVPDTVDDVQQPDPIVDAYTTTGGFIQRLAIFSLEELANKKYLVGNGTQAVLASGDAPSQVTIYTMNNGSVVSPTNVSLPANAAQLVTLPGGPFYVDVISGSVNGAALRNCGDDTVVQKLQAQDGASPRVHAYVQANLPAAGKRIQFSGWQATEILQNHFDPIVAVLFQYDPTAVQAFQNSYDVVHAWAALRSDGVGDKVNNPEVLTMKLTPKNVLKFIENSNKAVKNSNTAHLNMSSALKPKGLEQSTLGSAGAAAYRQVLLDVVLPSLVQENLSKYGNLSSSPGWN
jgi:hypothetical protein